MCYDDGRSGLIGSSFGDEIMHDADRGAALAALKQQLRRIEDLGLAKPAALSVREYLSRLAAAGAIATETAVLVAGVYERCRFGKGSIAPEELERAVAALEADAALPAAMDEEARRKLVEPVSRRAVRHNERKTAAGPRDSLTPRRGPPSSDPAAELVSRRKRRIEHGPSRLWTFIACGLALWTLAVMAGSLWQRERIERVLGASEWGRPLISHLRGEQEAQLELRRRIANDKQSATAADFSRLAGLYVERLQYDEAILAYQQGLARVTPKSPQEGDMLNNLAWLLLTAADSWYRDSVQAQQLAERAVKLCEEPEHCDTLAEAYSQNGNISQAVDWAKRALDLAKKKWPSNDLSYYRRQLDKFEQRARARHESKTIAAQ
jgi:hypothetical protein